MKKIKLYGPVKYEIDVVMIFSKIHEDLGFPELVPANSYAGFDIENIVYEDLTGRKIVTVEFEYLSDSFISHGHPLKMEDSKEYIIICWQDNCNIQKTLKEQFNKTITKVIELYDYVEIAKKSDVAKLNFEPKYWLLNYNPKYAGNLPIKEWKNSNVFDFRNGMNITMRKGDKILIKSGDYIVGGFEVERFTNIMLKKEEVEIFKTMINYPIGLFAKTNQQIEEDYVDKKIGLIFYNNFYHYENVNLMRKFKEILPNKGISYAAVQTLTEEEYKRLIGQN